MVAAAAHRTPNATVRTKRGVLSMAGVYYWTCRAAVAQATGRGAGDALRVGPSGGRAGRPARSGKPHRMRPEVTVAQLSRFVVPVVVAASAVGLLAQAPSRPAGFD